MKRLLIAIVILALSFGNYASTSEAQTTTLNIGWVVENQDYLSSSWNVMIDEEFNRLKSIYDIKVTVYQSEGDPNYIELVENAAEENAVVVSQSFLMADAIGTVAMDYPTVKFLSIDSIPLNHESCDENHENCVIPDNVLAYTFKEHEGSFIAGIAAGLTTNTNSAGFVGGLEFDHIKRFEVGYTAGVLTSNNKATIAIDYAESFNDIYRGFYYAVKQIELEAVDVIYHASGDSGNGVIEAADVLETWAIGVDIDQSYLSPEHVLCSMRKRIDRALNIGIISILNENFTSGNIQLGLAEGALDISDFAGNLKNSTQTKLLNYTKQIIDGKISVPSTPEALEVYLDGLKK